MAIDEKVYRPISQSMRTLMIIMPLLLIGVMLWSQLERDATLVGAIKRLGPYVIIGGIIASTVYRVAHTIVLRETTTSLEFRTFIGTQVILATEIVSVAPSFLQRGQLIVKHTNGSVAMPDQFDGSQELLEWIRKRNPHVVFKNIRMLKSE